MVGVSGTETVLVDIGCVDLLIALDEFVHLLLRVVEASIGCTLTTLATSHLHFFFKHHDLILLVCVLVVVVS